MEQYLGVKLVSAEPQFKHQSTNDDCPEGIEGYRVVYEDGYISWSPKDIFEKAYRKIKLTIPEVVTKYNWQDRVVKEAEDLLIKTISLDQFIQFNIEYNKRNFLNLIVYCYIVCFWCIAFF